MSETGLPAGWEIRMSNSRQLPYYFNPSTNESRWEPPADTDSKKLTAYMAANHTARPTDSNSSGGSDKIRAAHLLIKHEGSRRPSSWKEQNITRTKEEALAILERHEETIRSGTASLATIATTESDCSSARKGGDLGYFGRGDMQKEFEEAAFALRPGDMSGVVETASGLHLIERLA
ncbi:protein kinase ssp1 [Orbilia ellipsospora]|uniref:Peptidyl-prolyl cis-trans isomerase n=1 Tax=Orbilia ellipsospora TaxID=2528407 RepID=A0AAV9X774_9PEZI